MLVRVIITAFVLTGVAACGEPPPPWPVSGPMPDEPVPVPRAWRPKYASAPIVSSRAKETARFPEIGKLQQLTRDGIAPERSLGHVEKT